MNGRPSILDLHSDSNNIKKIDLEILTRHISEVFTNEPVGDIPYILPKNVRTMPTTEFTVPKIQKAIRKLKENKSPGVTSKSSEGRGRSVW